MKTNDKPMGDNLREKIGKIMDNATESFVLGNGYARYINQIESLVRRKVDEAIENQKKQGIELVNTKVEEMKRIVRDEVLEEAGQKILSMPGTMNRDYYAYGVRSLKSRANKED